MSHMGNLKLNQPANLIFSGDDKNKALNNIKFREKKIRTLENKIRTDRRRLLSCQRVNFSESSFNESSLKRLLVSAITEDDESTECVTSLEASS